MKKLHELRNSGNFTVSVEVIRHQVAKQGESAETTDKAGVATLQIRTTQSICKSNDF